MEGVHLGKICKGGGYQNRKGRGTEGEVTAGKVQSWPDPLGAVGVIISHSCYPPQSFASLCHH